MKELPLCFNWNKADETLAYLMNTIKQNVYEDILNILSKLTFVQLLTSVYIVYVELFLNNDVLFA